MAGAAKEGEVFIGGNGMPMYTDMPRYLALISRSTSKNGNLVTTNTVNGRDCPAELLATIKPAKNGESISYTLLDRVAGKMWDANDAEAFLKSAKEDKDKWRLIRI